MIEGAAKLAEFLEITTVSAYMLLNQGYVPARKVVTNLGLRWHIREEDAEEVRRIRQNPPVYKPEDSGREFVEKYGFKYPPLPFDYGEVYDDETDELLTEPSGITLGRGEATPDSLIREGYCTIMDWCDFLNEKRFEEHAAGPLVLPPRELHALAKSLVEKPSLKSQRRPYTRRAGRKSV